MAISILNDLLLFSCLAAVVTGIVMASQACSERNATFARTCGIVLRMSLRDLSKAVQVAFVAISALWFVNFSTQRLTVHSVGYCYF